MGHHQVVNLDQKSYTMLRGNTNGFFFLGGGFHGPVYIKGFCPSIKSLQYKVLFYVLF